jgi:peptidoglycan hydrolase-like protein with peptidoglycan-binding domain
MLTKHFVTVTPMNPRLVALTIVTAGVVGFGFGKEQMAPAEAAPSAVTVPAGAASIPADQTRAVQLVLSSFGYTIAVDGDYGPQTTKVVKSWQKSNGLQEDGIAGPITQASLGLSPADRQGNAQQVTPEAPPSLPHQQQWEALAGCESGSNWSINTGNGYYGGLQFSLSSWRAVGGQGRPDQASATEQMMRAEILLDAQGWSAWPACSRKLGFR